MIKKSEFINEKPKPTDIARPKNNHHKNSDSYIVWMIDYYEVNQLILAIQTTTNNNNRLHILKFVRKFVILSTNYDKEIKTTNYNCRSMQC